MNISWSTVFSSIVASVGACTFLGWLCREWISARLHKSIQHEYDIKLEDFKSRIHYEYDLKLESSKMGFQKVLDEHQTRFKYWYDEKAKAIKELYSNACELYYSLYFLQLFERLYGNRPPEEWIKKERKIRNDQITTIKLKVKKDWYILRLFLDDEEDNAFVEFGNEINDWSKILFDIDNENRAKEIKENGNVLVDDMKKVLDKLRSIFRDALYGVTTDDSLNGREESFHRNNQKLQSEQKPFAE